MQKPIALIIEDDRDIVALFRQVLDMSGYKTEIALHGQVALEHLSDTKPDIVLLDLNLPGISGIEILETMDADPRLKDVPVIVITAHAQIAATLPVEPDLILFKPVNINQLSNLAQRLRSTEGSIDESPLDETTGLYNRSFFMARLAYTFERSSQIAHNQYAVMFLDIDQFNEIEVKNGREDSVKILKTTAKILKNTLRPTDTIARFEYDHFLILIEDVPDKSIPIMIARRILENLRDSLADVNGKFQIQASIGIIIGDDGYENIDEILLDVDACLYLAKAAGGACYKIYDRKALKNLRQFHKVSRLSEHLEEVRNKQTIFLKTENTII